MRRVNHISMGEVRHLFRYESVSGDLLWSVQQSNRAPIGSIAGKAPNGKGYRSVTINGVIYLLHRLVWIYHYGDIPSGYEIDHKDRNPSNCRIENLRLATSSQNNVNKATQNKLGLKGVKANGTKFQARIRVNGKRVTIGSFDTAEKAHQAYMQKAKEIYGDFVDVA